MPATSITEILKDNGHRSTTPRRLVWQVLADADGHLTAEQIAARVHVADPTVNLSSVYRALGLFSELDLVRESNLGTDGGSRWERSHPDDQFHLVCDGCGEVSHHGGDVVEWVRAHLGDDHGFRADRVELVVTGLCAACANPRFYQ